MNAGGANPGVMPTADQLLEKFVQALGGADALQKTLSRAEKGTLTGFGGRQFPIEVFAKAADKRLSVASSQGCWYAWCATSRRRWGAAPHRLTTLTIATPRA